MFLSEAAQTFMPKFHDKATAVFGENRKLYRSALNNVSSIIFMRLGFVIKFKTFFIFETLVSIRFSRLHCQNRAS